MEKREWKDALTSVQELKAAVARFDEERDWNELNAANLAMSISIEAAELLEIFQWCDCREADERARGEQREHFLEELADVFIYCITMANSYEVDIASCISEKLKKNARKYPAKKRE